MEKKYFEAPYLKVVRVHNDIVTASTPELGMGSDLTTGSYSGSAPDREDWDEDGEW